MTIDELIKTLETVKEKFNGDLKVHLQYQSTTGREWGNEEIRRVHLVLDEDDRKEDTWIVLLDIE